MTNCHSIFFIQLGSTFFLFYRCYLVETPPSSSLCCQGVSRVPTLSPFGCMSKCQRLRCKRIYTLSIQISKLTIIHNHCNLRLQERHMTRTLSMLGHLKHHVYTLHQHEMFHISLPYGLRRRIHNIIKMRTDKLSNIVSIRCHHKVNGNIDNTTSVPLPLPSA